MRTANLIHMAAIGQQTGGLFPAGLDAVSSWFRLVDPASTIDTGYDRVQDVKNPSNPATQANGTQQPTAVTSVGGRPAADFDGTQQWWTVDLLTAANNQATATGHWAWLNHTDTSDQGGIVVMTTNTGCSANRLSYFKQNDDLVVDVYHSNSVIRRARAADILTTSYQFVTLEIDLSQATEALQVQIYVDAVSQTLAFSDQGGSPGGMPAALVQPTGDFALGAIVKADPGTQTWDGEQGGNFGFLKRLLTTTERAGLKDFEDPS